MQTVALTQTEKRSTRDHKSNYIQQVRDAIDAHDGLYLFHFENMRSSKFKNVRLYFREESRIFLGKNKLLQIALGRTEEDEYQENLHHVGKRIKGGCVGLLLTSLPRERVESYFAKWEEPDFARCGAESPRDVMVTSTMLEGYPVSMMEQFRKLGMPVEIKNGKVILIDREEWRLCKKGEQLSAEKCKLLVHFDQKLTTFKVQLAAHWSKGDFVLLDDVAMD
jgi:mRNA turnover protein 4